jgi:hypothetical protein
LKALNSKLQKKSKLQTTNPDFCNKNDYKYDTYILNTKKKQNQKEKIITPPLFSTSVKITQKRSTTLFS